MHTVVATHAATERMGCRYLITPSNMQAYTSANKPHTLDSLSCESRTPTLYTVNHKKRDILFLTITLANLNRFL